QPPVSTSGQPIQYIQPAGMPQPPTTIVIIREAPEPIPPWLQGYQAPVRQGPVQEVVKGGYPGVAYRS
ncbi:hypothetical protein HDU76_006066, partial [Blyttiomyces sp. JEL0837]